MLILYFKDIEGYVRKHFTMYVGSLLMLVLLFLSWTTLYDYQNESRNRMQMTEETVEECSYYKTSEFLSDKNYYKFLKGEDADFYRFQSFLKKMDESVDYMYITQVEHQGFQTSEKAIPKKFLEHYEEGYGNDSIFGNIDNPIYSLKALCVNPHFFDINKIEIKEGRGFSKEDYSYSKDDYIPVLLGCEYKELFEIGDTIKGFYILGNDTNMVFKIIGFLQETSFFLSMRNGDLVSTNRYIIIPSLNFENSSEEARTMTLQEITGYIYTKEPFDKVESYFNSSLEEAGLSEYEIYINNPNANDKMGVDSYLYITGEVIYQYRILLSMLSILCVMMVAAVIISSIREEMKIFGVELLCGMPPSGLKREVIIIEIIIFMLADVITFILTKSSYKAVLGIIFLSAMAIALVTVSCFSSVNKIKINQYLGGRQ